jgi:hypothetical protein
MGTGANCATHNRSMGGYKPTCSLAASKKGVETMNERIYTLAEQAGATKWNDELNGNSIDFSPDQLGQFAEMIVRECVKVMYDNAIERKVPPDINQTPTHYAAAVLKHFGVEE